MSSGRPAEARPARRRPARTLGVAAACLTALLAVAGWAGHQAPGAGLERAAETTPAATGWLHTDGGTIRDSNNAPYIIKATSWFGLETPDCVPHGLWGTLTIDEALTTIKSMGFNTVRLPFSNECLAATTIKGNVNYWANRAYNLEGKRPLDVMDAVVARAKANGLQIILDRHRPSSASQSPLWYTSSVPESRWISDWQMLATRYKNDPTVIGADLHNEPAGSASWGGSAATDWQAAATRGGNAVLAANPNLLVIVEGIENQASAGGTWWGGGLADAGAKPVTLSVPHRVVYSPHDYPSSLYAQKWFSDPAYPANLPAVWDRNWGYLQKQRIAPVLLGEFGTALATDSDRAWLTSLVGYLKTNGMSFGYWAFNPNSAGTGGLVQSDWRTPERAKLDALAPILAGAPIAPPAPAPLPSATPTAAPLPTSTAVPTPAPTTAPTTAPATGPSPSPTASPGPTGAPALTAAWRLTSSWSGGYVANLDLTAVRAVPSWSVSWNDPTVTSVANSWGMKCAVVPKTSITCTGSDWTAKLAAGQKVTVGLQVNAAKAPVNPILTIR